MPTVTMSESAQLGAESDNEDVELGSVPRRAGARFWTGRVMSAVAVLFLLFDGGMKVLRLLPAVEATVRLGFPASTVFGLGLVLLVCVAVYVFPPTAILGAILLTGYLGGAIAAHVRACDPLFSHTLFPIYVAVLLWGGLWLRDERLAVLVPLRLP